MKIDEYRIKEQSGVFTVQQKFETKDFLTWILGKTIRSFLFGTPNPVIKWYTVSDKSFKNIHDALFEAENIKKENELLNEPILYHYINK